MNYCGLPFGNVRSYSALEGMPILDAHTKSGQNELALQLVYSNEVTRGFWQSPLKVSGYGKGFST